MSVGEEYQVVRRGRAYHGFGENITWTKGKWGSNIILPVIQRMLGRISSREKGPEISRKKPRL